MTPLTVYVVEGPKGVVAVYVNLQPAARKTREMLARGEWSQVKKMEVR